MSVWPAWEVRDEAGATAWFDVRLEFGDGARVEALAVVSEGCVSIEDVRAEPALSLDDLAALADWIEDPLFEACGIGIDPDGPDLYGSASDGLGSDGSGPDGSGPDGLAPEGSGPDGADTGSGAVRPAWPRGLEGQWLVAQKYRAAQEQGIDPVLAVMSATGHDRRRSLRLISQARDAGFLTRRRARP